MTAAPETPDERAVRRARTRHWAARELAAIELELIVLRGAGPLSDDDGLIHGAPAEPDPHWRVDASLKGARHEPETIGAAKRVVMVKRRCRSHAWINADHYGRCVFCGEPVRDSDPELPEVA